MVSNLALFVKRWRLRLAFFTSVASLFLSSRTCFCLTNSSSMSVLTFFALVVPRAARAARPPPLPLDDACETEGAPLDADAVSRAAWAAARVRLGAMAPAGAAGRKGMARLVLSERQLLGAP